MMSALPRKADIPESDGNVRFVPKADICSAARLRANRVLVDIFLLDVMKTHESLYRFDNALRVSDQIMVCIRSRQAVGEPS